MKNPFSTAAGILAAVTGAALVYKLAGASMQSSRRPTHSLEVVLITGGSRGLGLALAKRFAQAGSRLVLVARDTEELERARGILLAEGAIDSAAQVVLVTADVTRKDDVSAAVQRAISHFGRVDVLINNAGIIQVGPFENQPEGAFEEAMAVNFFPAVHAVRAVLPFMLARGSGSIVNISSIGGKIAFPHLLPYVSSKFALTGFSEGLRAELRHKGVRVTTVCPGLMRAGSHIQAQFTGKQEDEYRWFALGATTPGLSASVKSAADKIFNAVASGRSEITVTPQAWLAARAAGFAPGLTQNAFSLVNHYLLPEAGGAHEFGSGASVRSSATKRSKELERSNNQVVQELS